MKKSILSVVISGALLLSGCTLEGDDGAVGATGASGPQGIQGSQGSAGENSPSGIELNLLARAIINVGGAAEIVQYHSASQVAYATDGTDNTIAMIDISGITSKALCKVNLKIPPSIYYFKINAPKWLQLDLWQLRHRCHYVPRPLIHY